jgi:hypothetical protein
VPNLPRFEAAHRAGIESGGSFATNRAASTRSKANVATWEAVLAEKGETPRCRAGSASGASLDDAPLRLAVGRVVGDPGDLDAGMSSSVDRTLSSRPRPAS